MRYENFAFGAGLWSGELLASFGLLFIVVVAWSIFWKGLALWHSAQRNQPWWFIILLFVNTMGILEIIYLFGVAKIKANQLFKIRK